jgi:hypothetical protein
MIYLFVAVIEIEIVRKGFNWCLNTLHNGRRFYLVPLFDIMGSRLMWCLTLQNGQGLDPFIGHNILK